MVRLTVDIKVLVVYHTVGHPVWLADLRWPSIGSDDTNNNGTLDEGTSVWQFLLQHTQHCAGATAL